MSRPVSSGVATLQFKKGMRKVTIQQFENLWRNEFENKTPDDLVIDFSEVGYWDQEFLLYLLAFLVQRKELGHSTQIELPRRSPKDEKDGKDRPLEFLMAWGFHAAVQEVLDQDFAEFLLDSSVKRFEARRHEKPRYSQEIRLPDGKTDVVLGREFFALSSLDLGRGSTEAADSTKKLWLNSVLVAVLNRFFEPIEPEEDPGLRFGSYILHEAVLNAAMHPEATAAMNSAQIENRRTKAGRRLAGDIVLAIWDDGKSFESTLQAADGEKLSSSFGLVDDKFNVFLNDLVRRRRRRFTVKADDPGVVTNPDTIALAPFLLGVTSLPQTRAISEDARKRYVKMGEEHVPALAIGQAGLGLHLIRKNVVDIFGGSLLYVSGGTRVRISRKPKTDAYTTTVDFLGSESPSVKGNLLIARIPLPRS